MLRPCWEFFMIRIVASIAPIQIKLFMFSIIVLANSVICNGVLEFACPLKAPNLLTDYIDYL
jgi:hypothetical protein